MRIKCEGCGRWHSMSATALAMVVDAFQQGDLTYVKQTKDFGTLGVEVIPICILQAFNDPVRLVEFKRRYKNNIISVESERK